MNCPFDRLTEEFLSVCLCFFLSCSQLKVVLPVWKEIGSSAYPDSTWLAATVTVFQWQNTWKSISAGNRNKHNMEVTWDGAIDMQLSVNKKYQNSLLTDMHERHCRYKEL